MGLVHRPYPAVVNPAMTPKGKVTTGGPVPSKKGSNMSKIKGMGAAHVATGKAKGLRSVPKVASASGFAGKPSGAKRSVPKTATSKGFAGKA